jgi:hypothetical protein
MIILKIVLMFNDALRGWKRKSMKADGRLTGFIKASRSSEAG